MINTNDYTNKDSLTEHINDEIRVIYNFINFETGKIEIHINMPGEEDYARGAFTLFGLSAAYKSGFEDSINVQSILNLFGKLHTKSKDARNKNHIYLLLYGMRMLNNFKLDYKYLFEELRNENLAAIYSYPVLTYIYMSAYKECGLIRDDKFLQSVYFQAYNTFEYIMYSSVRNKYVPFHFAELSLFDQELADRAGTAMNEGFIKGYLDANSYTSGVAKCLEHYTRINNKEMINKCLEFISSRSLNNNSEYLRPDVRVCIDNMYRETDSSNYICLDTNTHLLLSYLNLYTNIK